MCYFCFLTTFSDLLRTLLGKETSIEPAEGITTTRFSVDLSFHIPCIKTSAFALTIRLCVLKAFEQIGLVRYDTHICFTYQIFHWIIQTMSRLLYEINFNFIIFQYCWIFHRAIFLSLSDKACLSMQKSVYRLHMTLPTFWRPFQLNSFHVSCRSHPISFSLKPCILTNLWLCKHCYLHW